ncbi:MAG TPA: ABC transporter permease [Stellaceae bacterium]|jgi:NitT/TauT family transport system permease protein|nr:ABC transporter permease [Stellaceae bacterium]
MKNQAAKIAFWRIIQIVFVLVLWQWGATWRDNDGVWLIPSLIDPYFISKPSDIFTRFLQLGCLTDFNGDWLLSKPGGVAACLAQHPNNLWVATGATLLNTFWGFTVGTVTGVVAGLALGRSEILAKIYSPFIIAFNAIPRIAMVPVIILMFGLGDVSKVMTAWVTVFFVVFFNTFEGARSVDRDHIAVSRLFGATRWQIMRTTILPSTMSWVFASLTPALSFSLIGVIVAEFIGTERGLGKLIVEGQARADAADMMVSVFVLMIVGVALSLGIGRVQRYLLRWQAHYQDIG